MYDKTKRKCEARCDNKCSKWQKCLKELGLPADFSVQDTDTRFKKQYKSIDTAVDKTKKTL